MPPVWIDYVDQIHKDTAKVKESLLTLQKLHMERLKVFGAKEAEHDREIEILTQEITRLIRKSEQNIKRIALSGNEPGSKLNAEDKTVRLNAMKSMAMDLQKLSQQFRQSQKDFLGRLKGQENVGTEIFHLDDGKNDMSLEDALDRGLTPQQLAMLRETERTASEREKEIVRLAQSINDLAQIFQELNVLVIEQGSVLDRIDFAVENTLKHIAAGKDQLIQANETSKKMRTTKCILCLLVAIAILAVILGVKKSKS